jgi:hypothetical protein
MKEYRVGYLLPRVTFWKQYSTTFDEDPSVQDNDSLVQLQDERMSPAPQESNQKFQFRPRSSEIW